MNRRRKVAGAAYSIVQPTPVRQPQLLAWSGDLASSLGLPGRLDAMPSEFVEWLTGNRVPEAVTPYAHAYAGFQFGNWAGQLGDGRAITVGELPQHEERADGEQSSPGVELQLKGAGETPFSRFADGRAVLRSSVREFVASEAMAALGIPTTRALSLAVTGKE